MMLTVFQTTSLKMYGAIGLMFLATLAYAENRSHGPSERRSEFTMEHGKKWVTDTALQQGMENIRLAMAASQAGIEKDRLSAQEYQRLGAMVDKHIAFILKNCKLSKATDAAFHSIVLADLTQGTELMRTATRIQAQRVGALGIQQALRNYGEYFQHPDWPLGNTKSR